MNRIVRDHYPASRLPEDLREGLAPDAEVRVIIDIVAPAPEEREGRGLFSQFKDLRRINFDSDASVDAYVQRLRDDAASER